MTLHVKVSGAWKAVDSGGFQVKVSGAWKAVAEGWVKVSGAWKQFFVNAVFELPTTANSVVISGSTSASISFLADGTCTSTGNSPINWITPTSLAPGAYTIRVHADSGSPTGSALDSDLALSSTRTWTVSKTGAGTNTASVTITIKDGDGNTVASGSCTLTAQVLT